MNLALAATAFGAVMMLLGALWWRARGAERELVAQALVRVQPAAAGNAQPLSVKRPERDEATLVGGLLPAQLLKGLDRQLVQAGLDISLANLVAMTGLLALGGGMAAQMVRDDMTIAAAAGLGLASLPLLYVRFRRRRRLARFAEQFAPALDLLRSSLEAGHPLARGMQVLVKEFADPLAGEFRAVLDRTRLGLPVSAALEGMVERVPLEELRLFVIAVKVQAEVGSSLAQILARLSEIVRNRLRLKLQIRSLTAQGRFGGMIVGALPVLVLFLFSLIQPAYTAVLFHTSLGLKLLKGAAVLDTAAFLIIRRVLRVQY
ncbi:MAG: type II secretion system F family protein [Deltaproteobacteria bacterium]|nr:type II secretion system F family protein [Deltaproteobacteria bacterium]